jgi:hypothetical protein
LRQAFNLLFSQINRSLSFSFLFNFSGIFQAAEKFIGLKFFNFTPS